MAEKGFTDREMEIMAKAWTCMVEEPKVDYKKLAEACGMTNPRSASNAWAGIKKKIIACSGMANNTDGAGGDAGDATPKSTTKATPKRKKAAKSADNDDDEESPTKKAKATKGKPKKSATTGKKDEDADEGGDEAGGELGDATIKVEHREV